VATVGMITPETADIISSSYSIEGRPNREVLREILGILEHDGYIQRDPHGDYRPVSKLVNDWWKARFAFGYTPASERRG